MRTTSTQDENSKQNNATAVHRTLFVAGTFDDAHGKRSKIGDVLAESVLANDSQSSLFVNGGSYDMLSKIAGTVDNYDTIYWFANVSNEKEKFLLSIKEKNPHALLVSSKRNTGMYDVASLIGRALKSKSNLLLEFSGLDHYEGKLFDPLGNQFCHDSDFTRVGRIMAARVADLRTYTRVASVQQAQNMYVPKDENFFEFVRNYADVFHSLVGSMVVNSDRFLGNASFRCMHGFPSMRQDETMYVSARNVDKRSINADSFVPVRLSDSPTLEYYGARKPSVDSPIQKELYRALPNIRYMLHGHVYVKGAAFTKSLLPCGSLEEAAEILSLVDDRKDYFEVNLRGHGSIVGARSLEQLSSIDFVRRDLPEFQKDYLTR